MWQEVKQTLILYTFILIPIIVASAIVSLMFDDKTSYIVAFFLGLIGGLYIMYKEKGE